MGRASFLRSRAFSTQLAARLLGVVGVAALAAPSASCNGSSGTGTSGGTSTTTHGSGGAPATSGTTSTGGMGATGTGAIDAGISEGGLGSPPPGIDCFDWAADAGDCPTDPTIVLFALDKNGCIDGGNGDTMAATQVDSPPMHDTTGQCCYLVEFQWCVSGGRPYLVEGHDGGGLVAEAVTGATAWGGAPELTLRPELAGLDAAQRAALAAAWTRDALLEHASIASFARFSLSLLAAGAPASLLEGAQRAALDEIEHARGCFGLASAYAGEGISPCPFPVAGRVEPSAGLAALAASTVYEGCVGETIAAVTAAEQHARATDPAVRAVLARIAADEARHAELAWRTLAGAVEPGGAEVREAVAGAFHAALTARRGPSAAAPLDVVAEAHGRLDAATAARVAAAAMDAVVGPSARALLGAAREAACGGTASGRERGLTP